MHHPRRLRWRLASVIVAVLTLGLAATGMARPGEVIIDFNDDGFIQGNYSIGDLSDARQLMQVLAPARAGSFRKEVHKKISLKVLGLNPPSETTGPASSTPVGDLPSWFVGAAIGAGLLALGGAGSTIYRRVRQ